MAHLTGVGGADGSGHVAGCSSRGGSKITVAGWGWRGGWEGVRWDEVGHRWRWALLKAVNIATWLQAGSQNRRMGPGRESQPLQVAQGGSQQRQHPSHQLCLLTLQCMGNQVSPHTSSAGLWIVKARGGPSPHPPPHGAPPTHPLPRGPQGIPAMARPMRSAP